MIRETPLPHHTGVGVSLMCDLSNLLQFQQLVQRSMGRRRNTHWCQRHTAPRAASPPAAHHWTNNRASHRLLFTPPSSTKPTDQESDYLSTPRSH